MQNMQPLPAPPPLPTCYTQACLCPSMQMRMLISGCMRNSGHRLKANEEGDRWEKETPPRTIQSITVGWTQ